MGDDDATDYTTLADVHEERFQVPSGAEALPHESTGTRQLSQEFDIAALQYACAPHEHGYHPLASSDKDTLLRDVKQTRQQLNLPDHPLLAALSSMLCANPSACTRHGAHLLLTSDQHFNHPPHFQEVVAELSLW